MGSAGNAPAFTAVMVMMLGDRSAGLRDIDCAMAHVPLEMKNKPKIKFLKFMMVIFLWWFEIEFAWLLF